MKVLMKRDSLPIVKPFDTVVIKILQQPRKVEREITLKDGTVKKIMDYSVVIKPISGKFESVTEKVVTKTEDGDEVVKPKKYDASEIEKAIMKLSPHAFEIIYNAWQDQEIKEGTVLKIVTTKRQNKTYYDEIDIIEEEEEQEEQQEKKEKKQNEVKEKKEDKPKPKLKG